MVLIRLQLFKWEYFFNFQPFFQLDLRWPMTSVCDLDLINIWRFHFYIHKPSLVPIGLQLFKGDTKNKFLIFNLSSNLTSDDLWPQYVTLTSSTYEGSHFTSINQVWSHSDFNFSKETQIMKTKFFHLTWPHRVRIRRYRIAKCDAIISNCDSSLYYASHKVRCIIFTHHKSITLAVLSLLSFVRVSNWFSNLCSLPHCRNLSRVHYK